MKCPSAETIFNYAYKEEKYGIENVYREAVLRERLRNKGYTQEDIEEAIERMYEKLDTEDPISDVNYNAYPSAQNKPEEVIKKTVITERANYQEDYIDALNNLLTHNIINNSAVGYYKELKKIKPDIERLLDYDKREYIESLLGALKDFISVEPQTFGFRLKYRNQRILNINTLKSIIESLPRRNQIKNKESYVGNIKSGVSELFESNPTLANSIYEALGFKTKADVILPIGTSGSGKSTFIKSLPQENLVVIEPDAMRVEFTGNMNDKSKDKEIYKEAAKRAVEAIKNGKQVVFDTTNLTKDKRLPFIEAIKKAIPTANIQYKLMELNPELAKQRIKAQLARGENRAAVSDETIDRHAASYKQMLEDIKDEPISNFEITSQQKQEAQQLYSEYLEQNPNGSVEQFKSWVDSNQTNVQYQLPQDREIEEFVASEKTIRDLAARMSYRIGIPVRFESDRSKEYKGKLENGTAVVNLAYATLDTPIHEILGHPIIRAIKNNKQTDVTFRNNPNGMGIYVTNKAGEENYYPFGIEEYNNEKGVTVLYNNLLKELEYGKGKEVLDRIKRDYEYKDFNIIKDLIGSEIFKDRINKLNTELKNIPEFPKIENFKIIKSNVLKATFELSINGKSLGYITQGVGYFYWYRPSGAIVKIGKSSNVNEAFRKVVLKTLQEEFNLKYNISELNKNISKYSEKITVVKNTRDTSKGLYYLINESGDKLGNYSLEELKTIIGEENLPKYTLEEQQEEAIVELLGLYTAQRLDNVKDGKLISLLKRLLKEMKSFVRSLLNQKEVEIDKLPDNMTLGDIADLLAYSNSKLILPGNEVVYTTPDNQQFKTYAEASNHISDLAKSVEDVNLDNVKLSYKKINSSEELPKQFSVLINDEPYSYTYENNQWNLYYHIGGKQLEQSNVNAEKVIQDYNNYNLNSAINNFIEKNKEYEQSKEIIEEWKKVNNIQYNPEEVYSRGQGFYSAFAAYSDLDLDTLMANILHHIEDNEKAGGKFVISAFTKPIDKTIRHIEKSGLNFVIFPKPEHILWAANTDVFSGSVWDASEKVSKDKKSELLGVSYTKYPSLQNINAVQPNLANTIDNLADHHNELGIQLTGNNFRLEINKEVLNETDGKEYYKIKAWVDKINSILDQKYGKLVKPEIKKAERKQVGYSLIIDFNDGEISVIKEFKNKEDADKALLEERKKQTQEDINTGFEIKVLPKIEQGIQPTQTNETLKESIESVHNELYNNRYEIELKNYNQAQQGIIPEYYSGYTNLNGKLESKVTVFALNLPTIKNEVGMWQKDEDYNIVKDYIVGETENVHGVKFWVLSDEFKQEALNSYKKPTKGTAQNKEYTEQALINTKIAKLKEVVKKYPRSLIRSEVKPINSGNDLGFNNDGLPFQKLGSKQDIEGFKQYVNNNKSTFDKNLAQKIQDKLEKLYPEIKLNITNNPIWEKDNNVFNQQEYTNQINYRLKATEILLSDKAKQVFDKGEKNKWSLDKILTELAIPKEQKQLLLDLGITDREQLALELASTYGYSVEVNTAKEELQDYEMVDVTGEGDFQPQEFIPDTELIEEEDEDGNIIGVKEVLSEKGKKQIEERENKRKPTQHYSNLTVPGGTNYTENEIATPLITPSIKGHAQFATDKGIGWFRSDVQAIGGEYENRGDESIAFGFEEPVDIPIRTYTNKEGTPTKTRRILEIQSDLYQKGRNLGDIEQIIKDLQKSGDLKIDCN